MYVNISMKTDSSRHVTLIPDKPACVNPSFTAANCHHSQYTTLQYEFIFLIKSTKFSLNVNVAWLSLFFKTLHGENGVLNPGNQVVILYFVSYYSYI